MELKRTAFEHDGRTYRVTEYPNGLRYVQQQVRTVNGFLTWRTLNGYGKANRATSAILAKAQRA